MELILKLSKDYPSFWKSKFFLTGLLITLPTLFYFLKKKKPTWDVKEKVIIITGASSGIGMELAFNYSRQGAKLSLVARREKELKEVADQCYKLGASEVLIIVADVSIQEDCRDLVQKTVIKFERIDGLLLNAGISMGEFFEDVKDLSSFVKIMEVNYYHCVNTTYYALPYLIKSKGKICVTSSLAGLVGLSTRSGYSASKAAVNLFFESLRNELAFKNYDVSITVICPGVINTDFNRTRLEAKYQTKLSDGMPLDKAVQIIDEAIKSGEKMKIVAPSLLRLAPYFKALSPHWLMEKVSLRETKKIVNFDT